jgi:hypothetical protein
MNHVKVSQSEDGNSVTVSRRHAPAGDWLSVTLTKVTGGFLISRTLAA